MSYLRERYPFRFYLPIAAAFTAAAFTGEMPQRWMHVILSWVTVVSMVFQFRLWDDLGDLAYDRIHHPDRVLCRAASVNCYAHAAGAIGLLNVALLVVLGRSYLAFVALSIAAVVWYGAVGVGVRRSVAGRHVTLLKYPAMVLLIAPARFPEPRTVLAAVLVYLSCAIYEVLHDNEIRTEPSARMIRA